MVRKKNKKTLESEEKFEWPFKIDLDLTKSPKPKVAFLSGQDRGYYPEDPGYSRFGVAFALGQHDDEVPNPSFTSHSFEVLEKPAIISRKGYGIGGLSGPRFCKESHEDFPAPNAYQAHISKKVHEYVTIPPLEKLNLDDFKRECVKHNYSFGSRKNIPRFGKTKRFSMVGVGYYDLNCQMCKKVPFTHGFGRGPVVIAPPTWTHCNYEGVDQCMDCGISLPRTDYYRTRFKVRVDDAETSPSKEGKLPVAKFVSLCRKCYCKALRGSHKMWKKQDVLWLFRKTRHCSYIHEHNQMPIATMKTSCAMIKRLTRKEAVMAKYFPDKCERIVKEVE